MVATIAALAVLTACVSTPPPQLERITLERPHDALDTACRAREAGVYTFVRRMVVCDLEPFLDARDKVIDTWGTAAELQARLTEEKTHHRADRAVDAGKLAAETARANKAEDDQWIWGGAGVGIGVVLAGLLVGFLK